LTTDFLLELTRVERLANGSRLGRLLGAPGRYLFAIGLRRLRPAARQAGVARRARTFFGTEMTVLLPAGTDIYLTGGKTHDSEIRLARYLIRHLRPGAVLADVGAHFGYFSLLAARLVGPAGQVVAFEASAATFAVLAANVAAAPAVLARHAAVADHEQPVTFYEFPALYNEYNALDVGQFAQQEWFASHQPVPIQVPALRLDAVFGPAARPPDIIKIDVEGAELHVLRGATALLTRAAPAVVLEYLAPARHNEGHQQAAAALAVLGYQPHRITADGQLTPCPDVDDYLRGQGLDSDNFVFVKSSAFGQNADFSPQA